MKIEQFTLDANKNWSSGWPGTLKNEAHLVFVFGSTSYLKDPATINTLKEAFPKAYLLGCSTAGEIVGNQVHDDTLVVTAVHFTHTKVQPVCEPIDDMKDSFSVGEKLVEKLDKKDLVHVFVLSDGVNVNGSELVKGMVKGLPPAVRVTGGLSGDGANFKETYVMCGEVSQCSRIAAIGLYGSHIKVGFGSLGGWDPFGPERLITKSKGNILYELDNQSALGLYKKYLGDHAEKLPASGLLFPLSLKLSDEDQWIIRTILGVDEAEQSMTFAGDMPEGSYTRLMKANFERLIDGASGAAQTSYKTLGAVSPDLAILISCVGRKMVLGPRTEEEIDGVRQVLGDKTVLTGFYSYGEIAPMTPDAHSALHNQTMTITTLLET